MESTLTIEWVPLERLTLNPANPRINDSAVPHVRASLARFGWQQPIVAKRSGEVIAGNTRLKAATEMGMEKVPVAWFDGTDLDAVAYSIADNKTHEFADWDEKGLVALLDTLRAEDSMEGVGFTDDDIKALLASIEAAEPEKDIDDPGAGEPPEKPATKPGDLWILGDHRLLCGDSTKAEDVERLLGGAEPHLMVTDPPYGVEYDPAWRQEAAEKGLIGFHPSALGEVANDSRADWSEAWALFGGDVAYVWHASLLFPPLSDALLSCGFELRSQIVWAKSSFAISRGHYHWQHETCVYAVRKGKTGHWNGDRSQTTLWSIPHNKNASGHGTEKPLECMARPMRNSSAPGDAVYDPFCGSGTSIIAAEKLGRKCLGMDIDAAYVDVSVRRWQDATGLDATLDGDGRTFSEIAKGCVA